MILPVYRPNRLWRVAFPVVMAVTIAACGTSSAAPPRSSTTTTTTTRPQTLAQRYTAVVSAGDAQLQRLSTQLNKANGNVAYIQTEFRAVAATYRRVASQVQAMSFPAAARPDVVAMTGALATLAADGDQGAQSVTPAQFNSVFTKLATDQKAEVTANNTVNHDLGISAIS